MDIQSKKFVITISREFGSGGKDTGKLLADRLGIKCYDKTIGDLASVQSGLSKGIIENAEEKRPGVFDYTFFSTGDALPLHDKIFFEQSKVIQKLSSQESCIIIGRCANYLLRDYDNLFNFFIYAPLNMRIKRISEKEGISAQEAEKKILRIDKNRSAYFKHYTDSVWGKAQNYDLCLNSKCGIETATDILERYIKDVLQS